MVHDLSRQFVVYESLLKKLAEKQAMNERGLKHVSSIDLDRSLLQDFVKLQAFIARPSSIGFENRPTAMCNTKSTDDSSSVLRHSAGSELLERSATLVEFDERQVASGHWAPIETARVPAPASALCLSTTATNLANERESCVTSRESEYFTDFTLEPDVSHHEAGEEGSLIESISRKDFCFEERLHTDGVVWKSIELRGGSPIQLSKAQRTSIQEDLRRVAASSGKKARLLEGDTGDFARTIFDVQIEERIDLLLRPNIRTCHAEPDNYVVRVSHEETSSEYSDSLGNNSENDAQDCEEREAAGNWSVSQTEDEGYGELQAPSNYEHFKTQATERNQKPVRVEAEVLPLIVTPKIDAQNQSLAVCQDPVSRNGILHVNSKQYCTNMMSVKGAKMGGSSQNLQIYVAEEQIEGTRIGKRKRCEDDTFTTAITVTKLEAGLAPSIFPSNYMGGCFGCKRPLISEEKVDCSRNDCDRVYHLYCAIGLSDASWSYEGKLVCPQHVCYACGKYGGAKLWRCQNCPLATHENCIPCPEVTTLFHERPGWAICWRHASDLDYKLKTPTWDCQDIFRYLPVPEIQQDFNLSPEFIKEVMENEREPPPYFFIKRNVFLIKKKRDDADDGVGCSCKPAEDVCGEDCECRVQSMSCSKDCKCSEKCSNKPFRKDKRLKVCKTAHCGWGAFAAEAIRKDEFIVEYTGEVINDAMCEKRLWEMKGRRSICNFYMCEIAKDFIIDATRKGNASRYLNHSCQPNCRLEKWRVDGETRVGVFAGRNIAAGEELNYDYKYVEFGPNVTCRCGAPNCRGAIGERFNSNRKSTVVRFPIKWGSQHKRSSLA